MDNLVNFPRPQNLNIDEALSILLSSQAELDDDKTTKRNLSAAAFSIGSFLQFKKPKDLHDVESLLSCSVATASNGVVETSGVSADNNDNTSIDGIAPVNGSMDAIAMPGVTQGADNANVLIDMTSLVMPCNESTPMGMTAPSADVTVPIDMANISVPCANESSIPMGMPCAAPSVDNASVPMNIPTMTMPSNIPTMNIPSMNPIDNQIMLFLANLQLDIRPFKCTFPQCQKSYKNMNGLKYHLQHSHCIEQRFYKCEFECPNKYKNLNGLKYHYEHKHPDVDCRQMLKEAKIVVENKQ